MFSSFAHLQHKLSFKPRAARARRFGCALLLITSAFTGAARANTGACCPQTTEQTQTEKTVAATVADKINPEAASVKLVRVDNVAPAITDPAEVLRRARLIYVRKKSVYFKAQELENELRKRPEFQAWQLAITRDEADADLVIEVGRKVFTSKFVYTVIDPRTEIVVTSGKLNSIGGTLATKIAKRFIEQMRDVRPPAAPSK